MDKLIFGTDGWRDIIGDKFTFSNISRATQAYADYLTKKGETLALVGYDTRFNGELFAKCAAEVLAANGLEVRVSQSYLPTPALSFATKHYSAGGGIMLTASHNPPHYHGFKLKGPYGGTATPDIYQAVSKNLENLVLSDVKTFDAKKHSVESFDIKEAYYEALKNLVDISILSSFEGKLLHDAMGGAATGWLKGFVDYANLNFEVQEVHSAPHPLFYGVNPEPIAQNLLQAQELMQDGEAVFCLATDGDADRLGAVLPGGEFFNSHQIFAVLLDVLNQKGEIGKVVTSFTVARVVHLLAKKRGLEVIETPVGFKYIVDAMLTEDVLIGGEESGGIGVKGHIPERDGIANGLLLLEAMITSDKSLAETFAAIELEIDWKHAFDRFDLRLTGNTLKDAVMKSLENPPTSFSGHNVTSVERLDGVKLNLANKAWLMFRPSGTEPLLRIYCEAQNQQGVKDLLNQAQLFVKKFT